MQADKPLGVPPGTIQIDPDEGFGPHMADAFVDLYGDASVFVTATVDCLTWRFIHVLIKADKLPSDHAALQYGEPAMREALEELLRTLSARGMDKPSVLLMRSAVGHDAPRSFEVAAGALLGDERMARWLCLLEQEDYAAALALLRAH